MDPINANIIHFSDTRYKPRTYELMWWGLSIIETLLFTRLFWGDFFRDSTRGLSYGIYEITNYVVYPFTIAFGHGAGGSVTFVLTTMAAMVTYFLLTIGIVNMLKAGRSPRSRVEHARALSRRKYSR